jgi:hypothetical protein
VFYGEKVKGEYVFLPFLKSITNIDCVPKKLFIMKKIALFAVLSLMFFSSFSQVRPAGRKHFEKFYKSTTYVVEDRDPFSEFNKHMKDAMERHWKTTPYKVISFAEFERMRTNDNASFMILAEIKEKNIDQVYQFINFVMGHKKREFERMPDLASVPLAYRDANDLNYLYKMGAFVKFMQTHANERDATPRMRLANFRNVNNPELKNMELWLLEHELAPNINTVEKIKQFYPYEVKIVTREQIAEAIATDNKKVAFLHKIGPEDTTRSGRGKCWKFVVTAAEGKVLFSANHDVDRNNPDALLASDLQSMAK